MREKLLRIRRIALDLFFVFSGLLIILSGVTRILAGEVIFGTGIILGVLGLGFCVWHVAGDFRWFRKACVYPVSGFHVEQWGYRTEGEPVFRLYRSNAPMDGKTFSICFNILLPPQGSRAAWEGIMTGLDSWMAEQPCSMRLMGRMSANSQLAEVEMCVRKSDATPAVLESLYDCYERTADKSVRDFGVRSIRVDYPDRGHVFYAAFDGFDIGRAVLVAGERTAWLDLGDSRGGIVLAAEEGMAQEAFDAAARELDEAFDMYVADNPIEGIRQTELVPVEEFEKLWIRMPLDGPVWTPPRPEAR